MYVLSNRSTLSLAQQVTSVPCIVAAVSITLVTNALSLVNHAAQRPSVIAPRTTAGCRLVFQVSRTTCAQRRTECAAVVVRHCTPLPRLRQVNSRRSRDVGCDEGVYNAHKNHQGDRREQCTRSVMAPGMMKCSAPRPILVVSDLVAPSTAHPYPTRLSSLSQLPGSVGHGQRQHSTHALWCLASIISPTGHPDLLQTTS